MSRVAGRLQGMRSQAQQPLRLLTYNILADKWSGGHSYCPPEYLNWDYRCHKLLKQLETYSPDVLCLQEVQQDAYDDVLQPWMGQHGYGSLYNPRSQAPGSTTVGPLDGVSLHYRRSLFSLVASQPVRFADYAEQLLPQACCQRHATLDGGSIGSTSSSSDGGSDGSSGSNGGSGSSGGSAFMRALMERQEGAVMALLQHEPSQQQLLACSTHLHWNPNFPDIKLAQAALLCYSIRRFLEEQQQQQQQQQVVVVPGQPPQQQQQREQQLLLPFTQSASVPNIPIIVGGDFNSVWRKYKSDAFDQLPPGVDSILSGVYQLLSEGSVGPSQQDHPINRQFCRSCSRDGGGRDGRIRRGRRSGSRSPTEQQEVQQQGQVQPQQQQQQQQQGPEMQPPQQQQQDLLSTYMFTTSGLQLQSSYFSAHGREPTLTTRTDSFSGCLDYVWLSKGHWQVGNTLEMPFAEPEGPPGPPDAVELTPCLNAGHPSDHLPVGCEAVLLLPAPMGSEAWDGAVLGHDEAEGGSGNGGARSGDAGLASSRDSKHSQQQTQLAAL